MLRVPGGKTLYKLAKTDKSQISQNALRLQAKAEHIKRHTNT